MTENQSAIRWDKDADGIVTLIIDDPTANANTMNELFGESMLEAVTRLESEKDDITGVVIASGKKTFFAGGNLNDLLAVTKDQAGEIYQKSQDIKSLLRRLETLGKPVVSAINGAALGGGLEICLATHHRIAVDGRYEIGLPEVTLGLLPGGGGVTRITRLLGVQDGLMNV
ncbi:MAG TPA: enoyl-CoA hydratase-related protein, partial [Nocardioides sp.]